MKRVTGMLMLVTFAMCAAPPVHAEPANDEQGVRIANQAFYEAASARDLARMDAIWAHEPYVQAIHPTNMHVDAGWDAVRAGWQKLFESFAEISVAMPEPRLRVGDRMALVVGEEQFRGRRSSGEEVATTLLATSVFERAGDRWQMIHHHVSVPPRPSR